MQAHTSFRGTFCPFFGLVRTKRCMPVRRQVCRRGPDPRRMAIMATIKPASTIRWDSPESLTSQAPRKAINKAKFLAPLVGVLLPSGSDRRSSLRSDAPATFWQPSRLLGLHARRTRPDDHDARNLGCRPGAPTGGPSSVSRVGGRWPVQISVFPRLRSFFPFLCQLRR